MMAIKGMTNETFNHFFIYIFKTRKVLKLDNEVSHFYKKLTRHRTVRKLD